MFSEAKLRSKSLHKHRVYYHNIKVSSLVQSPGHRVVHPMVGESQVALLQTAWPLSHQ